MMDIDLMMETVFLVMLLDLQILDVVNGIGIIKFAFHAQMVLFSTVIKSVLLLVINANPMT